jgi:Na+-driven multidrug efflux pump
MLPPAIIFAITLWGLRVPFATLLQPAMGADAIWWSFPVGASASALLAFVYYRWGSWRAHELMSSSIKPAAS